MFIQSYTISSIKDIELLPFLKRAQFTLNGRMSPSKRKTVEALRKLNVVNTDVYIHYDFLRTIPRFLMMNEGCQNDMIREIASILKASVTLPFIKGLVIHMDTSFKKEFLKDLDKIALTEENIQLVCKKHISSPMYKSPTEIADFIFKNVDYLKEYDGKPSEMLQSLWYTKSFVLFDSKLRQELKGVKPKAIIYLENTTHVTAGAAGKVNHNVVLATKSDLFGVCWDTEHAFAAGDLLISKDRLTYLKSTGLNMMVHLNTIEKGVTFGSMLDRHSKTTIFECSEYGFSYYEELIKTLDDLNIPYIREVKSDTMQRELEQLKSRNYG